MIGSYDYRLVALSIVIAILASYAALDLAGRVTVARSRARFFWLSCGAIAMGIGIWSMHYIGMLAYKLPVPVLYDWPTVLLSLLAAIFASAVSLFVVSRQKMGMFRASVGSVVMGGGIAAMHYIGMAAMRLPAMHHYSPGLVSLSVILAIIISFVALRLTFHFRAETTSAGWRKNGQRTGDGSGDPCHALHRHGRSQFYAFCNDSRHVTRHSGLCPWRRRHCRRNFHGPWSCSGDIFWGSTNLSPGVGTGIE